jgi:hypothetical protein
MGERRNTFPDTHLDGLVLVVGSANFDTGKEYKAITAHLESSSFAVDFRPYAAADDLLRGLEELEPCIVHFMGHFEANTGELVLPARNDPRTSVIINAQTVASWFERRKDIDKAVQCVVLNGCSTLGLAEAIEPHVEYVIGMREEIDEDHAIQFADIFYRELTSGDSQKLGYAFDRAQESIKGLSQTSTGEPNPVLLANLARMQQRVAREAAATAAVEPRQEAAPMDWYFLAIALPVIALTIVAGSYLSSRHPRADAAPAPAPAGATKPNLPAAPQPEPAPAPYGSWLMPAELAAKLLVVFGGVGLRESALNSRPNTPVRKKRYSREIPPMVCELTRIVGENDLQRWPRRGPLCAQIVAYIETIEFEGVGGCEYRAPDLNLIEVSEVKPAFEHTTIFATRTDCAGLTLTQATEKTP